MPDGANAGGRPTLYTPATADLILGRLASGDSLKAICRSDDALPAESTVRLWVIDDRRAEGETEGFAARYARARDIGLDCMADELLDVADDGTNDFTRRAREDGSVVDAVDHEHISRSRLRVDTRKWYLSKLAPKRYGERIEVESKHSLAPELAAWLDQRG